MDIRRLLKVDMGCGLRRVGVWVRMRYNFKPNCYIVAVCS